MTEGDFWDFLENATKINGRVAQMSGYVDSPDKTVQNANVYIGGHSVLFNGHENIKTTAVMEMGHLLLDMYVSKAAKEAILMTLAHHPSKEALSALKRYNLDPDESLRYFAQFALEECEWWNE